MRWPKSLIAAAVGTALLLFSFPTVPVAHAEEGTSTDSSTEEPAGDEGESAQEGASAHSSVVKPSDIAVLAQLVGQARPKRIAPIGTAWNSQRSATTTRPPEFQFLTDVTAEECWALGSPPLTLDDTAATTLCVKPPATAEAAGPTAVPTREHVEAQMRTLLAHLRAPEPTVHVGPDPSVNEWDMTVVGIPLWLWTDAPRTVSTAASGSGIAISIEATIDSITYDMGDGNQVRCTNWTPRPPVINPVDAPSPNCGHTYSWPSLPRGEYTITATAHWTAQWSALGYSGSVPLASTATRDLPVGELQAVVVRR